MKEETILKRGKVVYVGDLGNQMFCIKPQGISNLAKALLVIDRAADMKEGNNPEKDAMRLGN